MMKNNIYETNELILEEGVKLQLLEDKVVVNVDLGLVDRKQLSNYIHENGDILYPLFYNPRIVHRTKRRSTND